MKSITFVGIVLLLVSSVLLYLSTGFALNEIKMSHFVGVLGGIGIGLIFGGMVGYVSKGSAIKEEQKRKEYLQLQKEKLDLEKQAAELANQQTISKTISSQDQNNL